MNNKLYTLSKKRSSMLNEIIISIAQKIEFEKSRIEFHSYLYKNNPEKLQKQKQKISSYIESHDVLETIASHASLLNRNLFRINKDLSWENETEIPIEIYKRGINTAIGLIQWQNNQSIYKNLEGKNKIHIEFLQELLDFRKQ